MELVAQAVAGGLSGGLGSVIAGGDFWRGAKQGAIVAVYNHAVHSIAKNIHENKVEQQKEQAKAERQRQSWMERFYGGGATDGGPGDPPSLYSRLKQWFNKHFVFKVGGEVTYGYHVQGGVKRLADFNFGSRASIASLSLIDVTPDNTSYFNSNLGFHNDRLEVGGSFYGGANVTLYENSPTIYDIGLYGIFKASYSNGNFFFGIDINPGAALGLGVNGRIKAGFRFKK